MEPLPFLRPHGRAVPLGLMKIVPEGPKFLFEKSVDMATVFAIGIPKSIVCVQEEVEGDCTTIDIICVSDSAWEQAWGSEAGVTVTVRQFLERCGVSFGNSASSSRSSNVGSSNNDNNNNSGNNNNNNNNRRGDNNNNNSNNNSRGGDNTGGMQQPSSHGPSQPSSSLPDNHVRILVHIQNECGEGIDPEARLQFAKAPEAMCSLQAGLDFLITREDNMIPPLLQLELKINAEFQLLSRCMVRDNGKKGHFAGVMHDELEMTYYGDTQSAVLLHEARMVDVYDLEVGKKNTTSKATGSEVGGEVTITGGHPYVIGGGGKLAGKRMRMSTRSAETAELTKVDALTNSSFTVDYNCRRRLHEADVLKFTAGHLPPMKELVSLEDAGLSLKDGNIISSSLGKSMKMSAVGEFFCQPGQMHIHTLELSRQLGEFEVSAARSFLRRLTRRPAATKVCLVTGKQVFQVQLILNHQIDFSLYGGRKITWAVKSFESPAPTLIDMPPPPS